MKARRGISLIAGIALVALPAFAQSTRAQQTTPDQPTATVIPADQQATTEQIDKMIEVLRVRKQLETMLGMMPRVIEQSFEGQVRSMNAKLPAGKRLTAQDQAALQKVMSKYMQEALDVYPIDEMIADAVPVYQRHITKSDADAVIAFYSSPAGQRLLDGIPAITQEYMGIVMSHMQTRSKHLTEQMVAEMEQVVRPGGKARGSSSPRS